MITTERLLLRRWLPQDHAAYAATMADEEVAYWIGGVFTPQQTSDRMASYNAAIDTHGFGRMAMVRLADLHLIGHCGLMPIAETLPVAPGAEIGWTLAREAWGEGYAAEAARAVLADGFQRHGLQEILAYTTVGNERSQAVMRRLGLERRPDRDFDHPQFPAGHPLCRHLVFVAQA